MSQRKISGPVRIGVVGTGGMGQGHCRDLIALDEACLTAVCDIDPEVAKRIGEEHGVPYFTDHTELIASGLVDAISIATPHPPRPPIAIDAMNAGLHVLAEKPLSERVSTADAMVAAAKENGVAFAVMFQRRTEPAFAKAIEISRSGLLGKVHRVTLISPEYRSQNYYDSGGWRATWSGEGGGVMMNQSPHVLDLFILLGGKPTSIFARVETRLHHIEVEDVAEAMVTYEGGGTGYFYCSTVECGPGQMIEVFGDNGKLCWRNGELKVWTFETGVEEFTKSSDAMWGGPKMTEMEIELPEGTKGHINIMRNFANHLVNGEALLSPAEDGIYSLELANAAWLSADRGATVSLPMNRADYDALLEKKRRESTFVKNTVENRETDPNLKA